MRWKLLSFLLVALFLVASAFAASEIKVEPVKNSIALGETASFKLSVTNKANEKQRYSIFSFVQGWDIEPFPLKDRIMEILSGETKNTTIRVKPLELFNPGIYKLDLNIESDLGEKHSENLNVYVSPEKPMDYLPSIKVSLDMNEKMNPQESQSIKLFLENKNPLNIPELAIKLQGDISEFNKETSVSLPPLEKKSVEFTIALSHLQKPGRYFLFFTFEKDGEVVKVIPQEIEIIPVRLDFQTDIAEEKSFLKVVKQISVKNNGNVRDTQKVRFPVSFWEDLFTKSTANTINENDQRYLSWEVALSPDETVTLSTTQNYRYPFYLFIVLILLTSIYLYIKSPVSLTKTATSTKKDATLSELKVTLQLKNLSKRPLKNIEVIDLIPGIADIEKSLDLGTLRPQEIKHTKKGTLVKWKLAEIEPKEYRLITYKIKSKLKILGALKLPRVKVIYGPKRKAAYSNTFKISSQSKLLT